MREEVPRHLLVALAARAKQDYNEYAYADMLNKAALPPEQLTKEEEVIEAFGLCPKCCGKLGKVEARVQNGRLTVVLPYCSCGWQGKPYGIPNDH